MNSEDCGVTAAEAYMYIAALIAVVIIGTLSTIGTNLNTKLNAVATNLGSTTTK